MISKIYPPIEADKIEMENGDVYVRYSPNIWAKWHGYDEETVYDCSDLEKQYQEYKNGDQREQSRQSL